MVTHQDKLAAAIKSMGTGWVLHPEYVHNKKHSTISAFAQHQRRIACNASPSTQSMND